MNERKNNFQEKAKNAAEKAAKSIGNFVSETAGNARESIEAVTDKINTVKEERKTEREKEKQAYLDMAMRPLQGSRAEKFLIALGESPLELTDTKMKQVKKSFPIPCEQNILWADAEFDLRPSGIAVTDSGIFIRTNVAMADKLKGMHGTDVSEMEDDEQQAYIEHHKQFHTGKSVLLFYSWDNFDTSWFIDESEIKNNALLVEPQCSKRFIETCRTVTQDSCAAATMTVEAADITDDLFQKSAKVSVTAGAAVESAQKAIFPEQKAAVNTPAGHGEMAEEANTMVDRIHGLDAQVVGRDNAKNGADRQIGDIFIQTKYYKSARGSLEACFSPENGQYRYMRDGKPMQLEVPKDQYEKVLEGFQRKIRDGKVPGVTDPNEASKIVRKGWLTYKQAVNLTKPGTIESLSYDAATGIVICSCAFGLTFVVSAFITWRETKDIKKAVQAGASAGLQVFGISFIQHMVISQFARTGLAKSLLVPSQQIVGKLGYHTSATIVNAIRSLSGKEAIYGIAASKHLAKILRTNVFTATASIAIFSIPDTYNMIARKISGAQYVKNMSVLIGSVAGGAGGAVAVGAITAKAGAAAGTAVAPGIGTAIGVAGGFIGGAVGTAAVKTVGDVLHEDDAETWGRLFNAYVSYMIGEYMLDEREIEILISKLDEIQSKKFKKLFENVGKAKEQGKVIREFLNPYFENIVAERQHFALPTPDDMEEAMAELMYESKQS